MFRNPISHYLQPAIMFLDLDQIKPEQDRRNVGDKTYQNLDDLIIYKGKGFHKIVVSMSLRKELHFSAREQFGHPDVQKSYNPC